MKESDNLEKKPSAVISFQKTGGESDYGIWWQERQINRQPEQISVHGIVIDVDPRTFSPNIEETYSVQLLLDTFPDVAGKRVLDIGTGTGILAIYAAKKGAAEVVATECDQDTFLNAKKNFDRHGLEQKILCEHTSDFEDFGKFDFIIMNIIFANRPRNYNEWPKKAESSLALHEKVIQSAIRILNPKGEIHFGFASFGETELLANIFNKYCRNIHCQTVSKFGVNWYHLKWIPDLRQGRTGGCEPFNH